MEFFGHLMKWMLSVVSLLRTSSTLVPPFVLLDLFKRCTNVFVVDFEQVFISYLFVLYLGDWNILLIYRIKK